MMRKAEEMRKKEEIRRQMLDNIEMNKEYRSLTSKY